MKIAYVGDSVTMKNLRGIKNASIVSGGSNWGLIPVGIFSPDIRADGNGTLRLGGTPAKRTIFWTAPGDTEGLEYLLVPGFMTLESGTIGKSILIGVRLINFTTTDTTATVSCSGVYGKRNQLTYNLIAESKLNFPFENNNLYYAIGGISFVDVVQNHLENIVSQTSDRDVVVFYLGTNDVSQGIVPSVLNTTLFDKFFQTIDLMLARGQIIFILNPHARFQSGTTTALTAAQQLTINKLINMFRSYVIGRHENLVLVDAFNATNNPSDNNMSPKTDVLYDGVHPSPYGMNLIGNALFEAFKMFPNIIKKQESVAIGNTDNLWASSGFIQGTGGTVTAPLTGTAPTGVTLSRGGGSDAIPACSIISRTDVNGNWIKISQASATIAAGYILCNFGNKSLATLGLSAGDKFKLKIDFRFDNCIKLKDPELQLVIPATNPATKYAGVESSLRLLSSSSARSDAFSFQSEISVVPEDVTGNLTFYFFIYHDIGFSGDVFVSNAQLYKV